MSSKNIFLQILASTLLVGVTSVEAQSAISSASTQASSPTAAVTAPAAKKWTCTAEGLAEFRYDGSGWAFIRLSAYATGHQYRVSKDESGNIAKGSTQDRTPFVCTNQ